MENKQTAVDWLFEKLWNTPIDKLTWNSILKEAQKKEKQQIYNEINKILQPTFHQNNITCDILTTYLNTYETMAWLLIELLQNRGVLTGVVCEIELIFRCPIKIGRAHV